MSMANSGLRKVEGEGAPMRMIAYALLAATLLFNRQLPTFAVLLLVAACLTPALISYAHSVRQRNGDEDPAWMKKTDDARPDERRAFRQRLAVNPFDVAGKDLSLAERISDAADLCVSFGRRAIVLSLTVDNYDASSVHEIAAIARGVLRQTDLVEVVTDREIIVGLAMIHDFSAAEIVVDRINRAVELANKRILAHGAAIYPLHGYTGEDLISAARQHSQARVPLLSS